MSKSKVVVVVPTYNEAGNVEATTKALGQVFKSLNGYSCHILFVDDNSPDGTAKVINKLMRKYSFVHLLNNKQKGGLGHAYKKGFLAAIDKYQADILFEFDADLQHDPKIIPAMLKQIEKGIDLVLGSRYIPEGGIPQAWPMYRKFLSIVGNQFIRLIMFRLQIHDWTTGYRAITRELTQKIIPLMNNDAFTGYTWQIGFLVKSIQVGCQVSEVPYVFRDRTVGHSKLGPEYIINTMRYIMKVRLQEIINNRIFKFVVTGGTGTLVQMASLFLYRIAFAYQLANFLSIETAIVSNFTLSNLWTFADRKLKPAQIPLKFVQFNLASGGSIVIQLIIAFLGERFIGLHDLFTTPIIPIPVDTGLLFSATGIIIGMFWNFFAYSHFVWKKK